jgi:hypothetical protein
MSRGRIIDEIPHEQLGERRIVEAIVGSGVGRERSKGPSEGTPA